MPSSLTRRSTAARLRIVAAAVLAFAAFTAESCSSDSNSSGGVTGTYQLTGIALASAPGIIVTPNSAPPFACGTGQECEFQKGSLTLNDDGTFSLSATGLQRAAGGASGTGTQVSFVTTGSNTGTWTQSGSSITFTPSVASLGTFTGTTLSGGDELRVNVTLNGSNNYVLRFEK